MISPLRLLTTFLALLFLINLSAQRKHDLHFGCHMTDAPIIYPKVTDGTEKLLSCDNSRSDIIDVLNYDLEVDLTAFGSSIAGECTVTFATKIDGLTTLPLDLLKLNIDSIHSMGTHLNFDYDELLLSITLPDTMNIGDTMSVTVNYHGLPTPDPAWGGFRYESGIAYNLGIGLSQGDTPDPFPIGRSLYPCFDNFVERATYDICVITNGGRTGYAVGELMSEDSIGNALRRCYHLDKQNPTYLTCIAASNYVEVNDMHSGAYGDYPVLLVGRPQDQSDMVSAFEYLGDAIDALEAWFGPYNYDQVGYVMTPRGAMEHSTLISYPYNSIGNGPSDGMNRLMAHELAHHWWGNTTTLSCPENMWIKEGNAEYSSHLFVEHTFGKEEFIQRVKANHNDVINNAHKDDGGIYHPLSGIPKEFTYGTHTYNKGASMMHNLRGYLGDELFKQSMTSILETFKFSAIDAQQMEQQLTSDSGIDMSHFFNNWIYQGGFANYEFETIAYSENGGMWEADITIQQKLHHATSMHTNTPMDVTFFDKDFTAHKVQVMLSGEMSDVVVTGIPFEPAFAVMNDEQFLNIGRLQDRVTVTEAGDANFSFVAITSAEVLEMPDGDSALLNAVHHLTAPDSEPTLPDVVFSNTHYWNYGGIIPAGMKMKAQLFYSGGGDFDLDNELLQNGDDKLILMWRPNIETAWGEYPFATKQALSGVLGRFRIDDMLPGDYAFAYGDAPLATSAAELRNELAIKVFPNPTSDDLNVQAILPNNLDAQVTVYDAFGRTILQKNSPTAGVELNTVLDVNTLSSGIYTLEIRSEDGAFRTVEQFVKN